MVQIIQMAQRYQRKPSEILNIDYDLLAYMVDEFSYYLEVGLMDKQGTTRWDKVKYKNDEKKIEDPNKKMMEHIEKYKKGPSVTKR